MISCQTELDCLHCGHFAVHTILYASTYIKSVKCGHCTHTTEKPALLLIWQYGRDLPARAFALTRRLKHEAFSHPILFAFSLPKRMIYKPIELSRELAEVCLLV